MGFEKSLAPATDSVVATRVLITRTLLAVWGGGTTVYLITLILAPPPPSGLIADWLVVVCGYSMFAGFVLYRRQLPTWAIDLNGYVGVGCASVVVGASGNASSPYSLFYLWVTVLSFHFLPLRRAVPQIVFVPVGYLVALHEAGGDIPTIRWVLLSATVAVVGFSVAFLRRQAESLLTTVAEQARTDSLTGLLNRRAFEEALAAEVARAHRTGQPLALIMGDLDHFKVINDRWGHPAGDEVLKQVADVLRKQCRRMDDACRIGGEEFAVIAPYADVDLAAVLAERIRLAVRATVRCAGAPVTISLGIATYPADGEDATALTAAADANCYRAKGQGRDRTIVAPPGLPRQQSGRRCVAVSPGSSDSAATSIVRTGARQELASLPNRDQFTQRLDRALVTSRKSGWTTAVLCAEVDDFKLINDTFGNDVADELLTAIGQRLSRLLRPGDTLARTGRDEFAILGESAADSSWLYTLVPRIDGAMTEAFVLSGVSIRTTMSVGIAVADNYDSPAMSTDELMREADDSRYHARSARRSAVRLAGSAT